MRGGGWGHALGPKGYDTEHTVVRNSSARSCAGLTSKIRCVWIELSVALFRRLNGKIHFFPGRMAAKTRNASWLRNMADSWLLHMFYGPRDQVLP